MFLYIKYFLMANISWWQMFKRRWWKRVFLHFKILISNIGQDANPGKKEAFFGNCLHGIIPFLFCASGKSFLRIQSNAWVGFLFNACKIWQPHGHMTRHMCSPICGGVLSLRASPGGLGYWADMCIYPDSHPNPIT